MKRLQVTLDAATYEALKVRARRESKSMSAVAREMLCSCLENEAQTGKLSRPSFIGSGSSGYTDISVRHDEYLAEDFA